MPDLVETTEHAIRNQHLFDAGERILVAVSGGVDSMVLLQILHELSAPHRWQLVVAHLNHQLRGRSSNADERLVRRFSERLGLRVRTERADVRAMSRQKKLSVEMAARALRHEFIARTARRLRIRKVALAHHADDQVELFFLRLLRGSGAEGLTGMKWRSRSPANPQVELVRPFLGVPKETLRRFAMEHRIAFREDASNACLDFFRNRIRHELLPLLKRKYQPALEEVVGRTAEILRGEAELVQEAVEAWCGFARAQKASPGKPILNPGKWACFRRLAWTDLPVALQRRDLQAQLIHLGISPDFDLVENLRRREPGKGITIRDNQSTLSVSRDADGVLHLDKTRPLDFARGFHTLELSGERGKVEFAKVRITWEFKSGRGGNLHKRLPLSEFFDADKVGPGIVLRHWRAGDRFQPIGMRSEVKLQDFFTNQKVPRNLRRRLVIAATASGQIFWVEGMRISERFKLTKGAIRRLHWAWERL